MVNVLPHRKLKIEQHDLLSKTWVNSSAPKGSAFRAPVTW